MGVLFYDANGNGIQDPDEPGIPRARLFLEPRAVVSQARRGSFVTTRMKTVTDAEGRFVFENVPFGAYTLTVDYVPPGYLVPTEPIAIDFTPQHAQVTVTMPAPPVHWRTL
ncbi:MAG: hypothetical protein GXP47_09510, partial [Acidobacteria bacterium]|nr:hypothetical protein [Acidobacteriota bacterium]